MGLKSIVPYLNKAVAAGIPIITFNSEPLILQGVSELDHLSHALVDIMGKIQEYSQNNTSVILEMSNNSRELSNVMNETSSISVDNNQAIETLSASTVEISAQMHEITKMVSLLKTIVLVLQGSLAQFNTDKNNAAKPSSDSW